MTVKELRQKLARYNEDAEVVILVSEDSRGNAVYGYPDAVAECTAKELNDEGIFQTHNDEDAIVVISFEERMIFD
jgi:hypothetical protein